MNLSSEQLATLYPGKIFLVKPLVKSSIAWKLKPETKVLFVMHESEFRDKKMTEFLKKIVVSAFPAEFAGFGVILKQPKPEDFIDFPAKLAVVFDDALNFSGNNPSVLEDHKIYFTKKLAVLEKSDENKKVLWENLKQIKRELGI